MQNDAESGVFYDAVARARLDPVWFCREILQIKRLPTDPPFINWDLDPWQVELLEAVADVYRKKLGVPTKFNHEGRNQITVRAMHGPGKTFGMAALLSWFGFCFKGRFPTTAPKLLQLKTRLWPEFRKIRARSLEFHKELTEVQTTTIRWRGADGKFDPDHAVLQESASEPENLAGFHDEFMLFCVDEASGVDEKLWPVIEGAMSAGSFVVLVIISNPTQVTGTFADSHLREVVSRHWYQIHISLDKTTRVSHTWVQKMVDKYGADSPVVRVRCLGEFAESDEAQLIAYQWLVDQQTHNEIPESAYSSFPVWKISADISDGGEDFTEIMAAKHYHDHVHVTHKEKHSFETGVAIPDAAAAIIALANSLTAPRFDKSRDLLIIDGVGVGAGVVGILIKKGYRVVNYKGGSSSDDKTRWRNRRVQSYICFRDALSTKKITFSSGFCSSEDVDDFNAQCCSIRTRPENDKMEDLETKKQLKNRGIKSPDGADVAAMQYAEDIPSDAASVVFTPVIASTTESYDEDAQLAY